MGFQRYQHSPLSTAWKIARGRFGKKPVPLIVNILLTYRCNLHCDYCEVWQQPGDEMDTDQILRLIDEIAEAGTERLSLGGGEPMLRRDVGTIINHAKQRSLTVNLVSNGRGIPRRIDELAGLDFLAVSLDGPAEIHDQVRGKGAFKRAIEASRAARAAGIEVWTTTVLTRRNIDLLPEIIELAQREDVRATFLPVMAEGLKARNAEILAPTEHQMKAAMDYLIRRRDEPDSPLASSKTLFKFYRDHWRHPGSKPVIATSGARHAGTLRCQAAHLFCSISPQGKLYPCNYLQDSGKGVSVIEQPFSEALATLQPPECSGCWCDSFIEANLIFGLHPGAIGNAIKILISAKR